MIVAQLLVIVLFSIATAINIGQYLKTRTLRKLMLDTVTDETRYTESWIGFEADRRAELRKRTLSTNAEIRARSSRIDALADRYESDIKEAISRNPAVKSARGIIDACSLSINPDIAYEMMVDANVGDLLLAIVKDYELLHDVITGKPCDVIPKIRNVSLSISDNTVKDVSL